MLERWEQMQRERGNTAGAEMARVMREQYGDLPADPTVEEIDLPIGHIRTPEDRLLGLPLNSLDLPNPLPSVRESHDDDQAATLGNYLHNVRMQADVGVRELGRRIGVSASYVSDIERGRRIPSSELLMSIAETVGADADTLFALAGRIPSETKHYLRSHHSAMGLLRRIAELNLNDEQLKSLLDEISSKKQPEQVRNELREGEEIRLDISQEDSKVFGAHLRQLREQSGMGANELARSVGVSNSYVSRIENGKRRIPSEKVLRNLAAVLNIDVEDLKSFTRRISERVNDYLANNPSASRLVKELVEKNLDEEKIQLLLQQLEQMSAEE